MTLREVALEHLGQNPLATPFAPPASVRKAQPTGQLTQQLEQAQVGPPRRLEPVRRRLRHRDGAPSQRLSEHGLELAKARLSLGDAAQVVLVEIEKGCRLATNARSTRSACSPSCSPSRSRPSPSRSTRRL